MNKPTRELLCQKCGCEYPVWFASTELWNEIGGDGISFLCLNCFAFLADEKGLSNNGCWKLLIKQYNKYMQIKLNKEEKKELDEKGEVKIGEITIKVNKKKPFLEKGQEYWSLDVDKIIRLTNKNDDIDKRILARDNIYLTEEEVKKADNKRLALGTIRQYMRDNDLIWNDVDWNDGTQNKWQITGWNYDNKEVILEKLWATDCSQHNLIFKLAEDMQKVLDNCSEELKTLLK